MSNTALTINSFNFYHSVVHLLIDFLDVHEKAIFSFLGNQAIANLDGTSDNTFSGHGIGGLHLTGSH